MIRFATLLLVSCALVSPESRAEWGRDRLTGCEVEVPHPLLDSFVIWEGTCENGKATGEGTLRASGATRIVGEFRKGQPFNATGQFMAVDANGMRQAMRVTFVQGKSTTEPLVDIANLTRIDLAPLVGFWDWQSVAGTCTEKHEYRATGEASVRNGDLEVRRLVQLYTVNGMPGWMKMVSTSLNKNRAPDCFGNRLDHAGESEIVFLRVDGEKLWSCTATDQTACTAVATRGVADPPRERNLITSKAGTINTARMRDWGGGASALGATMAPVSPIEEVFDRNKGALYALYGRALRDNPKLQGRFVVELDIAATGEVTDCRIKSSELNSPELEAKLRARIRLIRFGPLAAPITVIKAIDFFPAA